MISKRLTWLMAPLLASLLVLVGCEKAPTPSEQANVLFDELFMEDLRESPEYMTYLGMRERYDEWDDYSQAATDKSIARSENHLAQLQAIDASTLDKSTALSLALYTQRLENGLADVQWRYHRYPVNQMRGMHAGIPSFMINQHLVANVEEAQAYIARIKGTEQLLADVIVDLNLRADKGVIAPEFAFSHSIRDSRNIIAGIGISKEGDDDTEENPILTDFKGKVAALELGAEVEADLVAQLNTALAEQMAPAYLKLITTLQDLGERAGGNFGVGRLPEGIAYYNNRLKRMTTTDLTADQIHELGLQEVTRIHGEMGQIMQSVGFEGDLQAFFEFIRTDEQFAFGDTDEGRAAYIADATAFIDSMRSRLDELFFTKPKAPLKVKAVEAFREKSAGRAFYQRAAPDGSRPGTYYANLSNMDDMRSYDLEALAYHEGIPGHHMQGSISQ